MITVRKSNERGGFNHGWLDTKHTFSFDEYYDPQHMGFSVLRVINEDRVAPGEGFPMHGHEDMEIITYVISGALEHKDSMGNSTVIKPGEVQRMSAGTGVRHSEFNHYKDREVHLLQIWIRPDRAGYEPSYDQKFFADRLKNEDFILVASGKAASSSRGVIGLHQDVNIFVGKTKQGANIKHSTLPQRNTWVQVVSGSMSINGVSLVAGDGAKIEKVSEVLLDASTGSEFLLFDLP